MAALCIGPGFNNSIQLDAFVTTGGRTSVLEGSSTLWLRTLQQVGTVGGFHNLESLFINVRNAEKSIHTDTSLFCFGALFENLTKLKRVSLLGFLWVSVLLAFARNYHGDGPDNRYCPVLHTMQLDGARETLG